MTPPALSAEAVAGTTRRLVPPWGGGPNFLRVSEAAQLLDADPRTVRRAIEDGTLPHVRLSDSTIRIPADPFWRDIAGQAPGNSEAGSAATEPTTAHALALAEEQETHKHGPSDSAA